MSDTLAPHQVVPDWLAPPASIPLTPAPVLTLTPEQQATADALLAVRRRERALTRLRHFSRMFVQVEPARHHKLICDAVDDLMGFNNHLSPDSEFDVLVVMSPPASAKSTYISVAAPAYIIARQPTTRIISVSRAAELAAEFGGRVKNIIESPEMQLASDVRVAHDTRAKDNWKTTEGGGYFAIGASGGVLGKRADVVICDDIHASFEDAQSETQLDKIRRWFEGDLLSRLTPTGKLIVIGQRLNPNDVIGFVMQRAEANPRIRMRVLKFTAVAAPDVSPEHPDLLGRTVPGERMWPEFYTDDYLHDKKQDDFIWRTLWMQEPPSDAGSWVSTDDLRHRPTPPDALAPETPRYACSDLALSVNTGDYTVHFVVAIDSHGDWDIIDAKRGRVDPEQSSDDIVRLAQTYKPREWLIDDDNMAKVMMPLVATKARQLQVAVPWKMMPMRGQDKETRAAALRGQFKRRKVFYPADARFAGWLTKELLMFPNATGSGVDDGVDALSTLGRRLAVISPAVVKVVPTVKQGYSLNDLWDTVPKKSLRI